MVTGDFKIANIGNGNNQGKYFGDSKNYKRSSNSIDSKIWKCPDVVTNANWEGCHPNCGNQYGDRFNIKQHGDRVYAHRNNIGWGMNLSFKCYRKPNPNYEKPVLTTYCHRNWGSNADGRGVYNQNQRGTLADCQKKCDDKGASCKGITFGKPSMWRKGVCVMCDTTEQRGHHDWDYYGKKVPKAPELPPPTKGGYTKFDNRNSTSTADLTDSKGVITFKGDAVDGAAMCNHYSECTGFNHLPAQGVGTLKKGNDINEPSVQNGSNYHKKTSGGGYTTFTDTDFTGDLIKSSNGQSVVRFTGDLADGVAACNNDSRCVGFTYDVSAGSNQGKGRGGYLKTGTRGHNQTRVGFNYYKKVTNTNNRRAGVRKTYYDELKKEFDSVKAPYYRRKDTEIPQAKAARTTALNNQETTLKKQREDLQKMLNDKYSKLTKEHNDILQELLKKSADLEKKRQQLDEEWQQLQVVYEEKKNRILELQNEIKVETENAAALTAAFKDELARLEEDKRNAEKKIMEAKINIEKEKIKIDNIINDINKKSIEYSDLLVKSRARGEQIVGLEDIKSKSEANNKAIGREISIAPGIFKIHEDALKELEDELAKYQKNPKSNPIVLVKLLDRKKRIMAKLFDEKENKYNMNTDRLNRRHVVAAPSDILLSNQQNELNQNNRKIDNLSKDLKTSAKNTQINNNEYRKRAYFMFILKYISIFILLLLLVGLLIKNESIPKKIGYSVMGLLTLSLIAILVLNMYFNKNRNRIYFNKRDWPGMGGGLKKCPKT